MPTTYFSHMRVCISVFVFTRMCATNEFGAHVKRNYYGSYMHTNTLTRFVKKMLRALNIV